MSQSNQNGRASYLNKINLPNLPIFFSKFKAKHAIEERSQCLEESHNCFESKVAQGFRFVDLNFLIEQLRRGVHVKVSFLKSTAFSSKIVLLKLRVKINVKSTIL